MGVRRAVSIILFYFILYSCLKTSKISYSVVVQSENETDDVEMEEFEPLPTIEEAAMMAAGIHPDDDCQENEGLVILPHQLPRPVYTPPSPPPAVKPLYLPVDGKPVGK